jgi:menaquinone-dependent protoporphyrinogen oxidase
LPRRFVVSKYVVAFISDHGQTKKVAEVVSEALTEKGMKVELVDLKKSKGKFDTQGVDGVFLGGYIHAGKYPGGLIRFATRNRQALSSVPLHFFTVCLAARFNKDESRNTMKGYSDQFCSATGLRPASTVFFAGALPFTRYNPLIRFIMKKISQSTGGDFDTSRDYEYTDWQDVKKFAQAGMA